MPNSLVTQEGAVEPETIVHQQEQQTDTTEGKVKADYELDVDYIKGLSNSE